MDKKKTYSVPMDLNVKTMPKKVQQKMTEKLVGDRRKKLKGSL